MIELLVLYILYNKTLSMYQIRQIIKTRFGYLLSGSFGSIHPILKRLQKDNFILPKKELSKGGKACCTYKITANGKKYFEEIIKSQNKTNLKIIETKLACLDICSKSVQQEVLEDIEIFYKNKIINLKNLLTVNGYNDTQKIQIKNLITYYENKKNSLSFI